MVEVNKEAQNKIQSTWDSFASYYEKELQGSTIQ